MLRVRQINHAAETRPCPAESRLFVELSQALSNLVEIQSSQIAALKLGDKDISGFDEEIQTAVSAWMKAREAYLRHIVYHGCQSTHDLI